MQLFITQLFNGITAGMVFAMIAVGYSLVYGILQQINFAHGYVYMLGAFITLSASLSGVPILFAILAGVVVGVVVTVLIERVAYRPVREYRMAPTVTAVGAGLVIENIAQQIWGSQTRAMPFPLQNTTWTIGPITVAALQLVVLAAGVAMAATLYLIANRTNLGRAMRAVRDDLPTAELMGMPVNRIVIFVYGLGAAFGVLGGVLYSGYYGSISVTMGFAGTLNAFTATIIGGIGSIWGPFWGGLALGLLQAMVTGYVDSALVNTVTFLVLIAFLLLRPNGLSGLKIVRRV
jgi:branched-chain amino acid transport system permease protein